MHGSFPHPSGLLTIKSRRSRTPDRCQSWQPTIEDHPDLARSGGHGGASPSFHRRLIENVGFEQGASGLWRGDPSGQLSNPRHALCQLTDQDIGSPQALALEKAGPEAPIPRCLSRTDRPLKPAQVDALIAGYQAGRAMKELAAEFGINRLTVSPIFDEPRLVHAEVASIRRRSSKPRTSTKPAGRLGSWRSGSA